MLGQKNKKQFALNVTVFILAVAAVFSVCSTVFATETSDEVASFRTMNTAIIKGSENVPDISVSQFLKNI